MEVLYEICAGLDVHARSVVACLVRQGHKTIRTFGTMTEDLLQLLEWLKAQGCTHVAIESTGVYWKPVFNILEGSMEVMLVNARHVKAVKGKKTDVKDCEWLADLLRHGLLKKSFIPKPSIRALRELTRYRESLVRQQTAIGNRIVKLAESGNIKIAQVASRPLGVSGRAILQQLALGQADTEKLASLAVGRLKEKHDQLQKAVVGRLTQTQRWVLRELLARLDEVQGALSRVDEQIERQVAEDPDPFVPKAAELIDTIPGIAQSIAQTIISEIGTEMAAFPSDAHLASWAGICPGNDESAGKRRNTRVNAANRYLKAALCEAAWAASHTKNTYLAAQYCRLARRIGKKKALVAVGHSILVIVYHVLSRRTPYQELGGNYFQRQNADAHKNRLIRKLEALGLRVTVEKAA
ncbi:MAG TPA: IS110 family transposase [Thermoanaerobaculia bacterium]|nr:IS110 family transposase [Thermoanaerobaculia bacterium]